MSFGFEFLKRNLAKWSTVLYVRRWWLKSTIVVKDEGEWNSTSFSCSGSQAHLCKVCSIRSTMCWKNQQVFLFYYINFTRYFVFLCLHFFGFDFYFRFFFLGEVTMQFNRKKYRKVVGYLSIFNYEPMVGKKYQTLYRCEVKGHTVQRIPIRLELWLKVGKK